MAKAFRRPYRVGRARTGLGGFATRVINKNELIDTYRGKMIDSKTADERDNRYMFEVNSRWTIDGANRRNLARYFNHSCRPNAESDVKGHRVIIKARKTIQPGEEIVYDYGKDYFDVFLKPVGCKCDKCLEKRAKERAEKRAAAAGKKPTVKRGKVAGASKAAAKKAATKKAATKKTAPKKKKKATKKRK